MPHNVLIVDDSALTRIAIKRVLEMVELDVDRIFEAENGAKALDTLDQNKIDLVLADLNMPQMGGVELIKKMKEQESFANIPVIVVSTESSVTRIKELLAQGIKDYLHKPFTPEEFRTLLARNLVASTD
jgi:two-component system chemotaxis response regulator CheY